MILRPCPFCSCSRIFPQGFIDDDGIGHPMCFKCYATAPTIEDWNTRHNPDRELLIELSLKDFMDEGIDAMPDCTAYLIHKIRKHLKENP